MRNSLTSCIKEPPLQSAEALLPAELRARGERGCAVAEYEARYAALLARKPAPEAKPGPAYQAAAQAWEAEADALYRELSNAALDHPGLSRAEPSAFAGIKNTAPRRLEAEAPQDRRWELAVRAVVGTLAAGEAAADPATPELTPWRASLAVVDEAGSAFLPDHAGAAWLRDVPPGRLGRDNRIAYANLLNGKSYPQTALHRNPLREHDGALGRCIVFGLIAPGNPRRAARLAFHHAALSHTRSGIFAPMALAAGLARGLVQPSQEAMREAALDVIPVNCRLAVMLRRAWHGSRPDPPYPWVEVALSPRHAIHAMLQALAGGETGLPSAGPLALGPQALLAQRAWQAVLGRGAGEDRAVADAECAAIIALASRDDAE